MIDTIVPAVQSQPTDDRASLRAELEATRTAFNALLDTSRMTGGTRKAPPARGPCARSASI